MRREVGGEIPHPDAPADRAEAEALAEKMRAGLRDLDHAIMFALSNRVAPATVLGWLTTAMHRMADLCDGDENALGPIRQHLIDPRQRWVIEHGQEIADEFAGDETCFKPLTDEELAGLAEIVSGGPPAPLAGIGRDG